ncbi:aldehyde dehydrogenase family protein [Roseovarius amoyensis]|uniref:aldehyde dehydrogenase family protein n=1 Tax=Roseovarius amoyensis TaxID=2211448 RepID=UPI000DBE5C51|nr:aldehyde dehydrogenase family protein [Roseovarius amoyensis]
MKNLIAGRWVPPAAGATLDCRNPSTGEVFAQIADSGAEDIDAAVTAARAAFDSGVWNDLSATERGRVLARFAALIAEDAEPLAALEAQDTGKPLSTARNDITALIRYFDYYGAAADKLYGEVVPYLFGHSVTVVHEPHGVTGHILPWNYPAQMFGRTLAPALAMGNCTVLKPAEDGCASVLKLADLANRAGLPDGVLNVITGRGEVAGAALAMHADVDFISFTGSPRVGQLVQKMAADHFAGCTLELGGKSPNILFDDADLAEAIPVICRSIVQNAGQTCAAGSRVLIHRPIYEKALSQLAEAFAALTAGAPEMEADCGPIITRKQMQAVTGFVARAEAAGTRVVARGRVLDGVSPEGNFVAPMLFETSDRDSEIACEEVFGPVLVALPFEDEADAIRLANGTDYGLVAAIWTRDGGRQQRLSRRVRGGQIFINCYGAGAGIELPFGGVGKSGHGREKGMAALHDFSVTKTIIHRYST